jgi:Trypsin-like peptidase domain
MVNQELIPLLARCTVRISTPNGGFGTGFFIAPGWVITCAHVVKGIKKPVDILWKNIKNNEVEEKVLIAEVRLVFGESSDVAFLKLTTDDRHPCIYIDPNHPQTDDLLYIFGYPAGFSEDYSAGDSITTRYEGESTSKSSGTLLKLKQGQIKSGFSGSPLLNMRTGGVVGIITTTRDPGLDMGGRAVPISMIYPSPKLPNLSIADRKEILEIIEGNRKSNKYNKRWRSVAKWNRNIVKTASFVALLALVGLVYLVLNPPEDVIVLSFARLIIASTSGYVTYLMIKGRDLDINKFRGIPVKSLATFLIVIVTLLCSFILIPDKPIFLRNLTGTSEYPVLGLIDEKFPQPLSQVLGLKKYPIVDTRNPVYEAIQAFREESGNNDLISSKYKERNGINIAYSLNNKNLTKTETIYGRGSGKKIDFKQTQSEFERDTVSYQEEQQEFSYSSVKSPLALSSEDALWTAPLELPRPNSDNLSKYIFLQYPKLSEIGYLSKKGVKNDWMQHIVQNNPDVRGFLGFMHGYFKNIPLEKEGMFSFFLRGCGMKIVEALTPTPYVRFVDIKNNIAVPRLVRYSNNNV